MGTILPDMIEPAPIQEQEKIGWDKPEYEEIPWVDHAQETDKKLPKPFSWALFVIFAIIFIFIFAKAIWGQPDQVPEKFPAINPNSLPSDCRYVGLTVKY